MAIIKFIRNESVFAVKTGNTIKPVLYEDLEPKLKLVVDEILREVRKTLGTKNDEIDNITKEYCGCNDFLGPVQLICVGRRPKSSLENYEIEVYICPHCKGKGYLDWVEIARGICGKAECNKNSKKFNYIDNFIAFNFDPIDGVKIASFGYALSKYLEMPNAKRRICNRIKNSIQQGRSDTIKV